MKTLLLTSTFLLAVTSGTLAADAIVYETAPEVSPAGFVWTGGYIGVVGAYSWGKTDWTFPDFWQHGQP
jgi:outer membrane immunogenic protein